MPRTKKKIIKDGTELKKARSTKKRKNIVGNFRGKEDIFFTKVRNGFRKLLESPFK